MVFTENPRRDQRALRFSDTNKIDLPGPSSCQLSASTTLLPILRNWRDLKMFVRTPTIGSWCNDALPAIAELKSGCGPSWINLSEGVFLAGAHRTPRQTILSRTFPRKVSPGVRPISAYW